MIRVVEVLARLNVGGPAVLVAELARGLDPAAFHVEIMTGTVGADEADHQLLRDPDMRSRRIPTLGRSLRPTADVRALAALGTALRHARPHVVHTHTAKAGVLGRLSSLATTRAARVHTFHGHLLHGYFEPRAARAVREAERALARVSSRLVAVGEQVRDDLLEAGIGRPDQYVVIPPGIPPMDPPARDLARRELDLPLDAPVVAVMARLTAIKRPDRLLEVAAATPDVTYLVAGEGPAYAETVAAAPGNVRFLGWRGDAARIWGAADLALLTSDNEGMPVSLIEAAACGIPAVATDVGSTREVVVHGETGLLAGTDAAELAAGVARLLEDDALRLRMGRAARVRAASAFGTERMVEAHARLYRDVATP